jgi:hypothetical protein
VVQSARRRSDRVLAELLTGGFAPGADAGISAPSGLAWTSEAYWRMVRRWVT